MLFDKCCQLLMRMVSPQGAGLILYCLIGGLSAVLPPPSSQGAHLGLYRHSSPRYSSIRTDGDRSSKMEQGTAIERLVANSTVNPATHSRGTIMGNGAMYPNTSGRSIGDLKSPNSRSYSTGGIKKVRGTTKAPTTDPRRINTQIVYTVADLMKFLRGTKLRISLAAKQKEEGYLERKDSRRSLSYGGFNDSKQRNDSNTNRKMIRSESLDKLRGIRKRNSLQKEKQSNATDHSLRDIRMPSNKQVEVTNKPLVNTFQSRKSRSGRNSAIVFRSNLREGREAKVVAPEKLLMRTESISNKSSAIIATRPKTLFNYSYHISAVERGSVFPHDPLGESEEFDRRNLFPSPYIIPYIGNKTISISQTDSPKSESIYESLKPRLRTRILSPNGDNYWHQRLANFNPTRQLQRNETEVRVKIRPNSNFQTLTPTIEALIVQTEENNNSLLNTNKTNVSKYGSLHVPKRMDSSYESVPILTRRKPIVEPAINQKALDSSSYNTDSPQEHINKVVIERNKKQPLIPSENEHQHSNPNSSQLVLSDFNKTISNASTSPTIQLTGFNKIPLLQNLNVTSQIIRSRTNISSEGEVSRPETDVTELYESDGRQPKMTGTSENSENVPDKKPKLDQKSFYEYLMKAYMGNVSRNFSIPEYRPGNFFRYDDFYPRKPVLDIYFPRPTPFFKVRTSPSSPVTQFPDTTITPFESKRTSIRVSSTFYPNRMQDEVLRFGHPPESPTTPSGMPKDDEDDAEFRDALEAGFTMEKLAYLLIGTCCGLSILCLCVVVAAIKCRRVLVEKRLRAQFRRRLYHNEMKDASPWQQQMLDHFTYLNRNLDSTRSSSCNCHCVTWSLGARNLEASSRPPESNNRSSSLYLCGQKKLPFGAASTLRYESMLGRKRPSQHDLGKHESSNTDSSQENDSLEQDSDSREEDGPPRQCTCINYTMWPVPADGRRAMYGLCTPAGHYIAGDCSHQPLERLHTIPKNCPPPVTGSNYLDRSEGVVYWSSNDERLI